MDIMCTLICIFLMTKNVDTFSSAYWPFLYHFLWNICSNLLPTFFKWLVILLLIHRNYSNIFQKQIPCQTLYCKYILPVYDLPFHFPGTVSEQAEFFNFGQGQYNILFSFMINTFWFLYNKFPAHPQVENTFFWFFPRGIITLAYMFKSIILSN